MALNFEWYKKKAKPQKRKSLQKYTSSVCILCIKNRSYCHLRDQFSSSIHRHWINHPKNLDKSIVENNIVDRDDPRVKSTMEEEKFFCEPKSKTAKTETVSDKKQSSIQLSSSETSPSTDLNKVCVDSEVVREFE